MEVVVVAMVVGGGMVAVYNYVQETIIFMTLCENMFLSQYNYAYKERKD